MSNWDVGDRIPIGFEARDPDSGELVAGATVTVAVTKPDGTTLSPAPTPLEAEPGVWHASFVTDDSGPWRWTWTASGTVTAVRHDSADVGGPGTYLSLPSFRKGFDVTAGDRDDLMLDALVGGARAVDRSTGRRPGGFYLDATPVARLYEVARHTVYDAKTNRWKLLVDEIGSLDGMVVEVGDGTDWTAVTDYRVDPLNALADSKPIVALARCGDWGTDLARITARGGWPALPADVVTAVRIQSTRFYRRKNSPEGTAGPDNAIRLARVDPDVAKILEDLMLPGFG